MVKANPTTFRIVGPDETASNRLGAVFEATDRMFAGLNDDCVKSAQTAPM